MTEVARRFSVLVVWGDDGPMSETYITVDHPAVRTSEQAEIYALAYVAARFGKVHGAQVRTVQEIP